MAQFKKVNSMQMQKSIWLVKIPRYISSRWEDLPDGSPLGHMEIQRKNKHKQVVLHLKPDTTSNSEEWNVIPDVIPLNYSEMEQVGLAVIEGQEGIICEGRIGQRFEVRPRTDPVYMKLKAEKIKKAQQPLMVTKLLDKAVVTNFKPVTDHRENIINKQRQKEQKMFKRDDAEVTDKLFEIFEKHQYYNIKDLVALTKQPAPHLKKLLQELCVYNFKGPNKFTWELKPENRHY